MEAAKLNNQSMSLALSTRRAAKKGYSGSGKAMAAADSDTHYNSIADAIMKKKKMASGGMVESDDNMETATISDSYEEDNMEATLKEIYDEEPADLTSASDDTEDNQLDMVSKIRKRMRKGV